MSRLQLSRMAFNHKTESSSFVGDSCQVESCAGVLGVYSIHHKGGKTTRYLSCNECGWKPEENKLVSDHEIATE